MRRPVLASVGLAGVAAAAAVAVLLSFQHRPQFPFEDGRTDSAPRRDPNGIIYTAPSNVLFEVASSTIDAGALPTLRSIAADITKSQLKGTVTVEGYTDDAGTDDYNYYLSKDRAEVVAAWLEQNAGISADRITVVAYGETHPVHGNDTDAQRRENRRVVIVVDK